MPFSFPFRTNEQAVTVGILVHIYFNGSFSISFSYSLQCHHLCSYVKTWTARYGSHESPCPPSWNCIILAFYPVPSAGHLPRWMYTRLMLSINGVCVSCWESNGATMCRMMMWDGKLSNHTFRLLFKHDDFPCLDTLRECQTNQMPSRP